MMRIRICLFSLACLLTALAQAQETNGVLRAQFVHAANGFGLPNLHVQFETVPSDGTPPVVGITDPLGMIVMELPPGTYEPKVIVPLLPDPLDPFTITAGQTTHARYRLVIPDVQLQEFFDLFFHVKCVVSQTLLPDAQVRVKRWPTADFASAAEVKLLRSSSSGPSQLQATQPGYFQFEVSKPGWEPYLFPTNGPIRLDQAHGVLAALKPVGTELSVTVTGKNPAASDFTQSGKPLTNVLVEIVGLSFGQPQLETIPAKQGYTDDQGNITFRGLPSVPWRLEVKRNGYEPYMTVVTPDDTTGMLPAQAIRLRLHEETSILARVVPADTNLLAQIDANARLSLKAFLSGMEQSESAGIERERDGLGGFGVTFDHLLPGRYALGVHSAEIIDGDRIRFGSASAMVDVADRELREVELQLEAVPAVVTGRILVFEESKQDSITFNEQSLRARSSARVGFHQVLPNGTAEPVVIETDSNGAFAVQLRPGRYLVQIPDLSGYSEKWWNIVSWDAYAGQQRMGNPFRTEWPRPDRGGYPLRSGHHHEIDLVIARNAVNVEANLLAGSPFEPYTYENYYSNAGALIHFLDLEQTKFRLQGPVERITAWERELPNGIGFITFTNVPAGRYRFSEVATQFYDFSNESQTAGHVELTIPAWSSFPGAFDGADGAPPAGGLLRMTERLVGFFKFPSTNAPVLEVKNWNETSKSYPAEGSTYTNWVVAYSHPDYPDVVWRPNRFRTPTGTVPSIPGFNMHTTFAGGWRTFSYSPGVERITVFSGGPNDPGAGPFEGSKVAFRLRTFLKGGEELKGITWSKDGMTLASGDGFSTLPLSDVFANFEGNPFQGQIEVPFRVIRSSVQFLSSNPLKAEAIVMIVRDMELSGTVRESSGVLTNISVRVFDQLNNVIVSDLRTDSNGRFATALQARGDPVFVEVIERGYKPVKRFLRPASKTADLTDISIQLEPLPAPNIEEIRLNRFGLFLPGVSKSGDFTGFNPDVAREILTARWQVTAEAAGYSYTIDELAGASVSSKTVQVADAIQEIWLIDRKGYTNSAALSKPQFANLFSGTATNSLRAIESLTSALRSGKRGDLPLFAFHKMLPVAVPSSEKQYTGRFFVPDLPPGLFEPYVVVITKMGAVGVMPYAYPSGAVALEGWLAPPWLDRGILNTIGMLNTFRIKGDDMRSSIEAFFPKGSLLPLPDFSSRITFVPQNAAEFATRGLESEGFLKYAYSIGVKSKIGVNTPKTGSVLALGSPKIGLETGGSLGITATGREKEVEISFSGFLNREYVTTNRLDRPALGVFNRALKRIGSVKLRAEGTDSLKFKAKIDEIGERLVMTQSQRGFYEAEVTFDLFEKTVVISIPYAGLVLLALDSLDLQLPLKLLLSTKFGGGAENVYMWETLQPRPFNLGSATRGAQPERLHFLGSGEVRQPRPADPGSGWSMLKPNTRTDILFLLGAQLKAVVGKDSGIGIGGYGAGLIELSAPLQAPDRGVRVKLNTSATGAPLVDVTGAVNGGFDWKINFVGLQYSAQHRWELLPISWQFGTEPFYSIYPVPRPNVVTPSGAPVAIWNPGGDVLVDQFYEAGAFDFASGGKPALAFTQTDPSDGSMGLMISVQTGNGFSAPVRVAKAAAILSAAIAPMPQALAPSGWMVVWSEIAAADLGNPMARSTIKYSIAADAEATSWNAPQELATAQTPAVKLDLQPNANRLFLLWLQPETSLLSDRREVKFASYRSNGWSTPTVALNANQGLIDFQFVTSPQFTTFRFALAARHRDGWLFAAENIDGRWGQFAQAAERHSILPSLFYDTSGMLWKAAFAPTESAITMARFENGSWTELGRIENRSTVERLSAASFRHDATDRFVITWTEPGAADELWQAWLSKDGTIITGPDLARSSATGDTGHLFLSAAPGQNGDATVAYHLFDTASSSIRMVQLGSEPAVRLQFQHDPNTRTIRLSWPARTPAFVLERATSLAAPVVWESVANVQTLDQETFTFIDAMEGQQFFRLRQMQ